MAREEVPRPRVGALRARAATGTGGRAAARGPAITILLERVGGRAAGLEAEEAALGIVVAAAAGVREGIVCVVDQLEFARSRGSLGALGGDAVGVGFLGGAGLGEKRVDLLVEFWVCGVWSRRTV